ncbi:CGI-32 protein [Cladochytrium replicatum]|nr:CGI-32 protein [Cladochytrium replicatum]
MPNCNIAEQTEFASCPIIAPCDFANTDIEFEDMKSDIARANETGFYPCNRAAAIGEAHETYSREVRPSVFDVSSDVHKALEVIITIGGIERILGSDQEGSVIEGLSLIKDLIRRAGNRIIILPGV